MGSGVGDVLHQHGVRVLTCLAGRGGGSRERALEAGLRRRARSRGAGPRVRRTAFDSAAGGGGRGGRPGRGRRSRHGSRSAVRGLQRDRAQHRNGDFAHTAGCRRSLRGRGHHRRAAESVFEPDVRLGPGARELEGLREFGLDIRVLEGEVGKASGIKMCYAAMTKGVQALGAELPGCCAAARGRG